MVMTRRTMSREECHHWLRKANDGFTAPEVVAQAKMNFLMQGLDPDHFVLFGEEKPVPEHTMPQRWMDALEPHILAGMSRMDDLSQELADVRNDKVARLGVNPVDVERKIDKHARDMAGMCYSWFKAKIARDEIAQGSSGDGGFSDKVRVDGSEYWI